MKSRFVLIGLIGILGLALGFAGCDDKDNNKAARVGLESIAITPASIRLEAKGLTEQLSAVVEPAGADVVLEWRSENPMIASVSGEGLVTAKRGGSTVVKVKAGGVETSTPVFVAVLEEFTVSPEEMSVELNSAQQLYVVTDPPEMFDEVNIEYKSDNTFVAVVSASGMVTGVGFGEAVITVSIEDFSKEITVIVENP